MTAAPVPATRSCDGSRSGFRGRLRPRPPPTAADGRSAGRGRDAAGAGVRARRPTAVRAQAGKLLAHVRAHPEAEVATSAFSLATTRAHLEHRAAVLAADRDGPARRPDRARRRPYSAAGLVRGGRTRAPRTAFLFSGQGSQRPGMGRELYDRSRRSPTRWTPCCARFDTELDQPLREVMWGEDEEAAEPTPGSPSPRCSRSRSRCSASWSPGACGRTTCIGHSVGEIAAAHVAGVLSLADACANWSRHGAG
jgi:acyl transferase domain-containing protein